MKPVVKVGDEWVSVDKVPGWFEWKGFIKVCPTCFMMLNMMYTEDSPSKYTSIEPKKHICNQGYEVR